jgi:hypothetical protein
MAVELVGLEQQNSGVCFAALRLVQVHHLGGLRTAGAGPDERPSAEVLDLAVRSAITPPFWKHPVGAAQLPVECSQVSSG